MGRTEALTLTPRIGALFFGPSSKRAGPKNRSCPPVPDRSWTEADRRTEADHTTRPEAPPDPRPPAPGSGRPRGRRGDPQSTACAARCPRVPHKTASVGQVEGCPTASAPLVSAPLPLGAGGAR